jgi:hypothetical protein
MVGRSWYVYEPSIREHRFGKAEDAVEAAENEEITAQEPVEAPKTTFSTWNTPSYEPEVPVEIPHMKEVSRPVNVLRDDKRQDIAQLSEMQQAWEEWFTIKRSREGSQEPVAIQSIVEEEDQDGDIELQKEEESAYEAVDSYEETTSEEEAVETVRFRKIGVEPPVRAMEILPIPRAEEIHVAPGISRTVPQRSSKDHKRRQKSNTVLNATLTALTLIAIAIGVIGSGIAAPYLKSVQKNDAMEKYIGILVGERVINK